MQRLQMQELALQQLLSWCQIEEGVYRAVKQPSVQLALPCTQTPCTPSLLASIQANDLGHVLDNRGTFGLMGAQLAPHKPCAGSRMAWMGLVEFHDKQNNCSVAL